ncbi:MAG: N-6 DNA methylase [Deltaproteobacteria bacterium HGW-Deltaproteobacteria-21]|nr:MAG: N-6 DNA methylase [Deltaproteobacteria bacterium HGW-Deltaproteobacteria-21]
MARNKPAPQPYTKPDQIRIRGNQIYSIIRQKWVALTPEERVRQEYLRVLVEEYGFKPEQIEEEASVMHRGSGAARADFLIWRTPEAKQKQEHALIVIECKADNVTISLKDYAQGANYAQYEHARFFVTHNHRETKYWKVDDTRRMPNYDEIANIPHADATDKDINELLARLKVFKEDEFAKLLHECHNVIRNREKLDPAAAFDEIAKILFVKVWVERDLRQKKQRQNLFTLEWLDTQVGTHPLNWLFKQTKEAYAEDRIFENDEEIRLKVATGREIVKKLQAYNLSDTSEDIKGIAFERFLGRTFRGEIGQFFTPRTIVEFMIRMVQPQEGDVICDPASGSGGFLIRFFEIVRQQILADADRQYQEFKTKVDTDKKLSPDKKATMLREKFDAIQATLDHDKRGSRLWNLANRCIFGTDANDRMARTSKMNMIMHGDGHGGVHHHDGFLNVNGIFEGRFDIVLTNPPFGANVEPSDVVHEADATVSREVDKRYTEEFGDLYIEALARVHAAAGKPIASLFEIPKGNGTEKERDKRVKSTKIKTEILFIERCLSLLKPGGRLGIVLPEGIFNNPSLAYVREFCENRAFIRAVVSLPQETFLSSGASVKASLLFLQKFTEKEQGEFDTKQAEANSEVTAKYASSIAMETARLESAIAAAKEMKETEQRKTLQKELADFRKRMAETIANETRALLKERFPYPIFLYEAEKVGITATGEQDQNELVPNDNQPPVITKTCLELYQEFRRNPKPFFLTEATA